MRDGAKSPPQAVVDHFFVEEDAASAAASAAEYIARRLQRAIEERGAASWVLAGGSTPAPLYRAIATHKQVSWRHVALWFGDERRVPPDHPQSNYCAARETLLDALPESPAAVHPMVLAEEADHPDGEVAARRYGALLKKQGAPFDVTLLGLGADGHTASLFPDAMPAEDGRLAATTSAPAEPRERITLTLRALRASRDMVFLVSGAAKAPALRRVLTARPGDPDGPPAARVMPESGIRTWFVDPSVFVGRK